MIKVIVTFLLCLMLTASILLNTYQAIFPATITSICDFRAFHENANTPLLVVARPVLQAFWESEFAPICREQQQQQQATIIINTVVQTAENLGSFVNALVEETLLPLSPFLLKHYRATALFVTDSCWESDRIKASLMDTWANTFEPHIPISIKEAWNEAFPKPRPINDMTHEDDSCVVPKLFFEWITKVVIRNLNFREILQFLLKCLESSSAAIIIGFKHTMNLALSLVAEIAKSIIIYGTIFCCKVLNQLYIHGAVCAIGTVLAKLAKLRYRGNLLRIFVDGVYFCMGGRLFRYRRNAQWRRRLVSFVMTLVVLEGATIALPTVLPSVLSSAARFTAAFVWGETSIQYRFICWIFP